VTQAVTLLKRKDIREKAHTTKMVAGAVTGVFLAIASAAVAVGAIDILMRIW
jgi:hypothetical protein